MNFNTLNINKLYMKTQVTSNNVANLNLAKTHKR